MTISPSTPGRRRSGLLVAAAAATVLLGSCATGFPIQRRAMSCTQPVAHNRTVTLLTWNLGYGGEGAGASFFYDGGKSLIPSSRATVLRNTAEIRKTLQAHAADIYLLQEAARPSSSNHNVDLIGSIGASLPCYSLAYSPKVSERFLGIHLNIGQATLSRSRPISAVRYALPGISGAHLLHQRYFLLVTRFAIPSSRRQLVVANLHLAVIDKGAATRMKQLKRITTFMEAEYRKGNYVLIGGDWNLQFMQTQFPFTTSERHLTWVHPFPAWFPPPPWHRGFDPTRPTVRSLDRPYRPGKNFTTIGDGFVYSPNVRMVSITTLSNGFAYSDHQPVSATIRLLPGPSN